MTRPAFHAKVGYALEPDRFKRPEARLLVMAAQSIALKSGIAPNSSVHVLQHLHGLSNAGKLKLTEVRSAEQYLETAADIADAVAGIDVLADQVAEIVRRVQHKELVTQGIQHYGKGGDVDEMATAYQRVAAIGRGRRDETFRLDGLDDLEAEQRLALDESDRRPLMTGIVELDNELDGGLECASLGTVVGGTGSGKSLFLQHVTVDALLGGRNVAYVSLEMPARRVWQRLRSNLLDMPRTAWARNEEECRLRMEQLLLNGLGQLRLAYREARTCTPRDLRQWVRDLRIGADGTEPFETHLLVVDYADKVVSEIGTKRGTYEDQGLVYEGLHSIAEEIDGWVWTASQAGRGTEHKGYVGLDAVADSMNKIRNADLVIGIARTKEDMETEQVRFSLPKRREGRTMHTIGPLPRDPVLGRIVEVSGRLKPWE